MRLAWLLLVASTAWADSSAPDVQPVPMLTIDRVEGSCWMNIGCVDHEAVSNPTTQICLVDNQDGPAARYRGMLLGPGEKVGNTLVPAAEPSRTVRQRLKCRFLVAPGGPMVTFDRFRTKLYNPTSRVCVIRGVGVMAVLAGRRLEPHQRETVMPWVKLLEVVRPIACRFE